ncbi:helix-turn-helix domain-containing protein [filamentous cyanobacterium LEGE 11480]|uniref:Helix-turn-helix domain-containing protein n=1 Tax=Romeriopsis navalis LEGE 11480 TaxID=2777977 RepID=A0A928VKI7_9CYAN|nr:helix-turn-helix domain-containing protein [Romeriopsis navalis]MBE9029423.1 helix-turn-helix domain-containing protein [Romeriopsis navalis LEGE 11480]
MDSVILTLEELATYLKLPVETIRDQVEAGQIPGRKIVDEWRFLQAAIDDWLRADAHHSPHHPEPPTHELDDNRPIFPTKAAVPDRPPAKLIDRTGVTPDNPWAEVRAVSEDDAAVLEIAAELRAEIDL